MNRKNIQICSLSKRTADFHWGVLLLMFFFMASLLPAQTQHRYLKKADAAYEGDNYQLAEENYRKANEKTPQANATYNLGKPYTNKNDWKRPLKNINRLLMLLRTFR